MKEGWETEEFSWLDLPREMVEVIIEKLPFSAHPYFACVCKRWRKIMQDACTPIYPIDTTSPLLLHSKTKDSGVFHYYSPSLNKTFQVDFPDFNFKGYEFLWAKDGLLLVYNGVEMMMVDPFSGYCLPLPGLTMENIFFNGVGVGIGEGGDYIILLIDASYDTDTTVFVYQKHRWELDEMFDNDKPFRLAPSSSPVYCDGQFYCLGVEGNLGVFDLCDWTWTIHDAEFKKYDRDCMNETYLVELSETVMAVQIENFGAGIHVFSLDRQRMVWEEIYDLGDRSLFIGSRMSLMSVPTDKKIRNRAYMHRFHKEPKAIIPATVHLSDHRLYFKAKLHVSNLPTDDDTMICSYDLTSTNKSDYFGSVEKLYCIWFQPYHSLSVSSYLED